MLNFDSISGINGYYKSSLELILQGSESALVEVKKELTLVNSNVQKQILRLKKQKPFSYNHQINIQKQLKELEPQLITECYAEVDEGLSVPPGFFYLAQHIRNPQTCEVQPIWMGDERYYQREAIEAMLKHKRASINLVTASGKTRILRVLCRSFKAIGKRVIVLVPSIELLKQTYEALKDPMYSITMGGDGKIPRPGSDVLIITAQSALGFCDAFQVVLCDEQMFMSCQTWQSVAAAAIGAEYFYGMSGSPEREDNMTSLIWAFAGPIVYSYTALQGISDGFISPVVYKQIVVNLPEKLNEKAHPTKEYARLHKSPTYLNKVKSLIDRSLAANRKTLVLFKSVSCCDALAKMLGCEAANGKYRRPFHDFKAGKTDLLIANINLLGIGIDVPNISCLILCTESNSEIAVIQAIGRAIRMIQGKKDAVICDVIVNEAKWIAIAKKRAKIAERYIV
jgi:superfamily II DNA or RNA helicase